MPVIQTSVVIGKNEDGSDTTQDVDVLVWWRDVGQARFPLIAVMARQFLTIPADSAIVERVFSFAGLTFSDLRKYLLEGGACLVHEVTRELDVPTSLTPASNHLLCFVVYYESIKRELKTKLIY